MDQSRNDQDMSVKSGTTIIEMKRWRLREEPVVGRLSSHDECIIFCGATNADSIDIGLLVILLERLRESR